MEISDVILSLVVAAAYAHADRIMIGYELDCDFGYDHMPRGNAEFIENFSYLLNDLGIDY